MMKMYYLNAIIQQIRQTVFVFCYIVNETPEMISLHGLIKQME